MAHYIFNVVGPDEATRIALRNQIARSLKAGMWGVDVDEPHRDALAAGDVALLYLGAPDRAFIGLVKLASGVHDWTPDEDRRSVYANHAPGGVSLTEAENWDPAIPMAAVLAAIAPTENARADFEAGVVRITANEYATAIAVAATYAP